MATPVPSTYVTVHDGALFVGETRVSLHSIIAAWQSEGYTPEMLQDSFPAVMLSSGIWCHRLLPGPQSGRAVTEDATPYNAPAYTISPPSTNSVVPVM